MNESMTSIPKVVCLSFPSTLSFSYKVVWSKLQSGLFDLAKCFG